MHKHRLLIKFGHATKHSIVVKIKKIPFFYSSITNNVTVKIIMIWPSPLMTLPLDEHIMIRYKVYEKNSTQELG